MDFFNITDSILVSTSSCNNNVTQQKDSPSLQSNDDMMNATILYPPHLHEKIFPNNNDDNTTRRKLCFHDIDSNIPIILFFHGGGFIMGESLDLYTAMAFENLVTVQTKKNKSSSSSLLPDLVFVSIEYRLAPEHPFPSAVIDCLSFMEYACSTECSPKTRKFHLAGTSAGGNLCTMVTMEHLRRYSDHHHRILSVLIDIPFLDPNANSKSYYMNSKASMTQWLIWCWRSYLSSKITTTIDNDKDGGNNYKLDFSNNQFHVETWMKQAKTKEENHMFRYIYPTIGIPPATSNKYHDNDQIKFIIVTSLADPLHDEGVELVNKMKEMGYTELKHYETISGHSTYFWCDKSMTKRIFGEWSSYIFQS